LQIRHCRRAQVIRSFSNSMSDIAISVENISKCYRIGTQGGPGYHRLSEMITGVPRALWNAGKSLVRQPSTAAGESPDAQSSGQFWALKDVSFEVKQGEVVGIIGRNGAGKSTLLKILSRITEPTSGRFGVRGRVASLLEVGTGFHPELTGRENIYVSGVTLGMTRAEIKKRFDEIVDFSGVEKFLDTPVKHYSSGMQVRLGFAVASHLESEILIVDEVLAVGDAEFQKKCMEKMEGVAHSGRSVLFVSHNLVAISQLCQTGIYLDAGRIAASGGVAHCLSCLRSYSCGANERCDGSERQNLFIRSLKVIDSTGKQAISTGEDVKLVLTISNRSLLSGKIHVALCVENGSGSRLTSFDSIAVGSELYVSSSQPLVNIECTVSSLPLLAGCYSVYAWVALNGVEQDRFPDAATIEVFNTCDSNRTIPSLDPSKHGPFVVAHRFKLIDEQFHDVVGNSTR
jgi:lipopolysaccharide transport system ATP-binding protein